MCKEYNGWSNYETWLVNLWLDNDQMTQRDLMKIANGNGSDYAKADILAECTTQMFSLDAEQSNGLLHDLLGAALSTVDWLEIIKANIEEPEAVEAESEEELDLV